MQILQFSGTVREFRRIIEARRASVPFQFDMCAAEWVAAWNFPDTNDDEG